MAEVYARVLRPPEGSAMRVLGDDGGRLVLDAVGIESDELVGSLLDALVPPHTGDLVRRHPGAATQRALERVAMHAVHVHGPGAEEDVLLAVERTAVEVRDQWTRAVERREIGLVGAVAPVVRHTASVGPPLIPSQTRAPSVAAPSASLRITASRKRARTDAADLTESLQTGVSRTGRTGHREAER